MEEYVRGGDRPSIHPSSGIFIDATYTIPLVHTYDMIRNELDTQVFLFLYLMIDCF